MIVEPTLPDSASASDGEFLELRNVARSVEARGVVWMHTCREIDIARMRRGDVPGAFGGIDRFADADYRLAACRPRPVNHLSAVRIKCRIGEMSVAVYE